MTAQGLLQLAVYMVVLLGLAWPLGVYIARVFDGPEPWLVRVLGPLERGIYRICGVKPQEEMGWQRYALAMLAFQVFGFLVVYLLQRVQGWLPLNPQGFGLVDADSAFNTAASFATNTNWQGYGGEVVMSYATQMLGLAVQNFVSAASGIAVLIALIRGIRARGADAIGNFWVDLVKSTLHVLLPLSLVLAVVLVSQGVVQNFSAYQTVPLLQATTATTPVTDAGGNPVLDEQGQPKTETTAVTEQVLPMGPAASQVAIKQLGTNGGGFFNVNSAHPFENPDPALQLLRGDLDPDHLGSAVHHVRRDGERPPPGCGAARRDDRRLRRAALAAACGRAGRAIRASPRSASTRPRARSRRAATWRARRSGSGSRTPRSGPPRRPPRRTARSMRCTTRSRRSAGSCRCS